MVLVIGAWLLLEPSKGHILNLFVSDVKPHETINLIAYSLLGLGFIVLTVGFFGCRAALRGNQCILATVSKTTFLLLTSSWRGYRYRSSGVKVGDFIAIRFFAVHEHAGCAHRHGTGDGGHRWVDDFPDLVRSGGKAHQQTGSELWSRFDQRYPLQPQLGFCAV